LTTLAAAALLLGVIVGGAYLVTRATGPDLELRRGLEEERRRRAAELQEQRDAYEGRMSALRKEVADLVREAALRSDSEVEARVVEVRGHVETAVAEVESSVLKRLNSEIERTLSSNPDLLAARRVAAGDAAFESILARLAPSVCLIQGSYGFAREIDGKWAFLREIAPDVLKDARREGDKVPLTIEGNGPIFQVEYTGTGFLADAGGLVLTNRHIAEPWWRSESAEPLLNDGFFPRFLYLRVFFPSMQASLPVQPDRTVLSDEADLAVLAIPRRDDLPEALPLAGPEDVVLGRRILLLGFPSGIKALIAKTDEVLSDALIEEEALDPTKVLDVLAERRMIRPIPTQGHVGDILKDKILYDAPTAEGGSGGPVLNMEGKVVAVNYGILKAFRGANFGVPAHFAIDLLARAKAQ
ncbi:MAG: S1 family peptidase, partial [Planctomycetota bacterium]